MMPQQNIRKLLEQTIVQQHRHKEREKHEVPQTIKDLMSPDSLEVLEAFGIDAPHLLNRYCCSVEDALIEQVYLAKDYRAKCIALADEVNRLRELISTDDSLKEDLQSEQ